MKSGSILATRALTPAQGQAAFCHLPADIAISVTTYLQWWDALAFLMTFFKHDGDKGLVQLAVSTTIPRAIISTMLATKLPSASLRGNIPFIQCLPEELLLDSEVLTHALNTRAPIALSTYLDLFAKKAAKTPVFLHDKITQALENANHPSLAPPRS